ncbi:MAG: hypothetical protein IMW98_08630 [Firmicutes bacterium]|nr:hypothetical protein [Bacillota bacterium]MBE3590871.1 hypothetical protein [Bacillota bacterium]
MKAIRWAAAAMLLILLGGCSAPWSGSRPAASSETAGAPSSEAGPASEPSSSEPPASTAAEAQQRLQRYVLPDPPSADGLAALAYTLDKQARMVIRGAAEAWLALGERASSFQDELLAQMRQELAALATPEYAETLASAMSSEFAGGEGEWTFPDRETVLSLKLVSADDRTAVVQERLQEHYPASEWGGSAFTSTVDVRIVLQKTPEGWRLADVQSQPLEGSQ